MATVGAGWGAGDNPGSQANDSNTSTGNGISRTVARRALVRAARSGNWRAGTPWRDHFNEPITVRHETALHIATTFDKKVFVKRLLREMNYDGLTVVDMENRTAFFLAAINGNMEIAKAILRRESTLLPLQQQPHGGPLVSRRDGNGLLPIHVAAFRRHNSMVRYLYEKSKAHLRDDEVYADYADLLVGLIDAGIFDLVLDTVEPGQVRRATAEGKYTGETAFNAMAKKPEMFSKVSCWRKPFSKLCCRHLRNGTAHELLGRIWLSITEDPELQIENWFEQNLRIIHTAVERGNIEFLRVLIRNYPDLLTKTDDQKGWTIFHFAIFHRQEKIFALIYEIGSLNKVVAERIDRQGKNMLHLAAELAPESRLEIVPGAALQLQHELLWYQEVKVLVGPQFAEAKTLQIIDAKTPQELFVQSHEDLIKRGQEWMRNTANSCIIVAILVATVAFAAAFTLPGGNNQDSGQVSGQGSGQVSGQVSGPVSGPVSGFPVFLHRDLFKIFVVANGVSFVCSISSVLGFLSVLSSSYALKEFAHSLPRKLLIGLSTLLASIMAMMLAFVTVFFMYFKERSPLQLQYAVPVAALAFIPICLFVFLHRRIYIRLIKSTCIFKCSSLFSPDHRDPLF